MAPLVSVICLCYNHARFVRAALQSVIDQTYSPIELMVIDDSSTDDSANIIAEFVSQHPEIVFIHLPVNRGNCHAFNKGLARANGKYVIDLAADDILLPDRVDLGVALMEANPNCGVQFSDSEIIDEEGHPLGFHSDRFPHSTIPSGKIFTELLSRYFINSPTMMVRKSLLDELRGYDESLAYEDFDFWVRSAQGTDYLYIPKALIRKRTVKNSLGNLQHSRNSIQQSSTLKVCLKAEALCKSPEEFQALKKRVAYELKRAVVAVSPGLAWGYIKLLGRLP